MKTAYFAVVVGIMAWGIVTLALQSCRATFWLKHKHKLSLLLSTLGALLFIISSQPYAAAFLLLFLVIKGSLLLKWQ